MSENHSIPAPADGVPVDVPIGSTSGGASAQVSRVRGETGETNTPASHKPENPLLSDSRRLGRGRIGAIQLARIAEQLGPRDAHVLASIAAHSYLSTKHIEGLRFSDHHASTGERLARRTMMRLERAGLVQALDRRVGGVRAGSSARIWQLSSAGRRLAAHHTGAKRPHEPSPRLLAHALAVADTRLAIADLPREDPSIDNVEVQVESSAWRQYLGLGGDRRLLQPDLAVVLHGHDDDGRFEDRWFIEVDCGTESLPTLMKKCQQYEDYRQSGSEQSQHDVFPRILWIMGGPRATDRADKLRERLSRGNHPAGMFTVALVDEVAPVLGGDMS